MDDYAEIMYLLIGRGPQPLAGYYLYKGVWVGMCEKELINCRNNYSDCIEQGYYKLFYLSENDFTYMIMTTSEYPKKAAFHCLESMKNDFYKKLRKKNYSHIEDYGLNKEFKDKLKAKYDYYSDNPEEGDEKLKAQKKEQMKLQEETKKLSRALNKRKEKLSSLENRSSKLSADSYNFRMAVHNFVEQRRREQEQEQANLEKNKKESGFSIFNLFSGKKKLDEEKIKIDEESNKKEIKKNNFINNKNTKSKKSRKFFTTKEYINNENNEVYEEIKEDNRDDLMNKSFCIQGCNLF